MPDLLIGAIGDIAVALTLFILLRGFVRISVRGWLERDFAIHVWRSFKRPDVWGVGVLALAVTGGLLFLLMQLPLPALRWGWLNLLGSGGGSAVTLPVATALDAGGAWGYLGATVFLGWFWVLLPFLAWEEERIFREGPNPYPAPAPPSGGLGTLRFLLGCAAAAVVSLLGPHLDATSWSTIARRATVFGLAHLILGIPLLAGIALIGAGLVFGARYRYVALTQGPRHAVMASTSVHAFYNSVLIGLCSIAMLLVFLLTSFL